MKPVSPLGKPFQYLVISLALLFSACPNMYYLGLPDANPQTGYGIVGYLGNSSTAAAPGIEVTLINAETGLAAGTQVTDFMGKYRFYPLQPGRYILKAGHISHELTVTASHIRHDINLASSDGNMNYAAGALENAVKEAANPAASKPNDSTLMGQFAGVYWGYSGGSTLSGGGGTERQYAFCPDGQFYGRSESGYYGTGSWGSASQTGSDGGWSIQGSPQGGTITVVYSNGKEWVIRYQAINDPGCFNFDGSTLCRKGACR